MARIVIAAGGTGGHIYPALSTAEVLRDRGHVVSFVGGDRIERRLVPEAGFELHELPARSLPRRPSVDAVRSGVAFLRSLAGARRLLRTQPVDVVLGMGGYPSLAPSLASGPTPLVLHEQNAVLSLAHRLSAWRAAVVALSLPVADRIRTSTVLVGNPLRARLAAVAGDPVLRAGRRADARERWGLAKDVVTVLVFGGSLGASVLNETVPGLACFRGPVQVLHIAGEQHAVSTEAAWARSPTAATVLPYVDEIEDAYAAADLVVSRSGASTVAELAAFSLPSVLVPLPQAPRRAQEANARVLEEAGASRVVLQGTGFSQRLADAVSDVLSDGDRRSAMGSSAATIGHPDAAPRLADVVEAAARR